MQTKKQIEAAKKLREEHKRACLICATTVLVIGVLIGSLGFHGLGLVLEVTGLYLVALV